MSIRDYGEWVRALEAFERQADPGDPKARKQRRIVEAATELFIRHGYRKTSIDDVADQAGIAKGTVYLYFKTKGDLLLQAIVAEKKRGMEAFREIFGPSLAPRERLRLMLRMAFVMSSKMPLTARLTSGDREFIAAMQEIDPAVMHKSETMQLEMLTDLVMGASRRRKPTGEMRDRAKVLRGLLLFTNMLVSEHARQGLPIERYAEVLADLLVDGVVAVEKGR